MYKWAIYITKDNYSTSMIVRAKNSLQRQVIVMLNYSHYMNKADVALCIYYTKIDSSLSLELKYIIIFLSVHRSTIKMFLQLVLELYSFWEMILID